MNDEQKKARLSELLQKSFFRGMQKGLQANVEQYLAARVKPKPGWFPAWAWRRLCGLVLHLEKFEEVENVGKTA